jgi:flagellar basal-body rod protein FlgF
MISSIEQITSSVDSLLKEYSTIAHNLANVSTSGFKRTLNSFSKQMEESDGATGTGLIEAIPSVDFTQGSLLRTGRPLDVSISGKGFFVVERPDESPIYCRNGVMHVNKAGQMVDLEGRLMAGAEGPIVIPPEVGVSQINIAGDGSVSAGDMRFGRLKMVDFGEDEGKLASVGKNCFAPTEELEPQEAKEMTVRQGFLENSNVRLVEELVSLVTVTRQYETNMKLLTKQAENAKVMVGVANS